MVDIIISSLVAVLTMIVCCCYLKLNKIKSSKNIGALLPRNFKQTIFGIGMILSSVVITLILSLLYDATWLFTIKRLIICIVLWPIAFIDYRKHIIPNKILLSLLIVRSLIAIVEMMMDLNLAKTEFLSSLIAAVGILILLCVMRLIVKNGIGFGDVKLFAVLGLFLGLKGIVSTMFLSFIVSFFVSIFLLVSKRKNKKEQIAFAPSILVGTLLSVIFLGA